ncbi:CHAP domain-containing protein [Mesorhizobium kowhaii]|uniref:Cytoplasmic protein n=1 Tax=Mesorhizobium kowhaii TaxID=1300272 RepID=A0A2W7CPQ2_9HYPH|nr:CHAP domain-containing protein [Mesorhizobium kowhaii]PZV35799.1 cytoplasmic protein [Mesorhizobium kowhaii]
MPWDRNKAISFAQSHAQPFSTRYCAKSVREAIESGGVTLFPTNYAKDYGRNLTNAGFVETNTIMPMPGDVVVIQPIDGHPAGHMAIYDGRTWISDFKQNHGFYPNSAYRRIRPKYKIYRHP